MLSRIGQIEKELGNFACGKNVFTESLLIDKEIQDKMRLDGSQLAE